MNVDTSILFEPADLGALTSRNRIAMPAIHLGMASRDRGMEEVRAFYQRRARGGAGLVTVGVCNTWAGEEGKLSGALQLARDEDIEEMSRLCGAIRGEGALAGVQLSPLAGYDNPRWTPDADTIGEMIESIGLGARRAREAGFDFVELMLSGGSILSHLVSPVHNKWNIPGYSGDEEQRMRAPLEAVEAIRARAGDITLTARIHCHEFLEGGYGTDGAAEIAVALQRAGVDGINITGAGHRTSLPQLTSQTPPLAFAHLARAITTVLDIPTLYGGRLSTPREATGALRASGAAFVNMGRALVVDPLWPQKARTGDASRIVPCMTCGRCFDQAFSKQPLKCSLNPEAGNPLAGEAERAPVPEKVVVIGGGPAGLQAAWSLASKGHEVTLYEQERALGGRWSKVACLEGQHGLAASMEAFASRLGPAGVKVVTGRRLTPEEAASLGADLIVLAVGSRPRMPRIPGMESHPSVHHTDDVLRDDRIVGDRVAIIGAGGAGVELAIHLASRGVPGNEARGFLSRFGLPEWTEGAREGGRAVTLLKRKGFIGKGIGRSVRWTMVRELELLGVRIMDRASYEEITPRGVRIQNGRTGEEELIEADTIVLATGYEPDPGILASYEGCAPKVIAIGDAVEVANIAAAVEAGWAVTANEKG